MKPHATPFLGPPPQFSDIENARVVILPFPYEGGVSFGRGTAAAPQAILEASHYLEPYDEVLDTEPYQVGIATVAPPQVATDPEQMVAQLERLVEELLAADKFVVVVGGDHSISSGYVRALAQRYSDIGVLQLDAHADLRHSYQNSPLSHACVMARIREITPHTFQVGIRSMSAAEALHVRTDQIPLCTMHEFRRGEWNLDAALAAMPRDLFITFDVDVFDWSVIASTGTPEPGGMLWDEAMTLLWRVFQQKNVVGFDVVELAHRDGDPNSAFATAKLIYKMIGFKFAGYQLAP